MFKLHHLRYEILNYCSHFCVKPCLLSMSQECVTIIIKLNYFCFEILYTLQVIINDEGHNVVIIYYKNSYNLMVRPDCHVLALW